MTEPDDETLRKKSAALKDALARRRTANGPRTASGQAGATPDSSAAASGMALGMRAAGEFIAAVAVGGLLGWGLDRVFGTKPLFLIVFFLLGVAAGVLGVIRATSPKRAP